MTNALKFMEELVGPTTVGMLIRAYRTLHELTLDDLALKLDLPRSYISDVENGRKLPSLQKTMQIARALGDVDRVYARVWMEQTLRSVEMTFEEIADTRPVNRVFEHKMALKKHGHTTKKKPAHRKTI